MALFFRHALIRWRDTIPTFLLRAFIRGLPYPVEDTGLRAGFRVEDDAGGTLLRHAGFPVLRVAADGSIHGTWHDGGEDDAEGTTMRKRVLDYAHDTMRQVRREDGEDPDSDPVPLDGVPFRLATAAQLAPKRAGDDPF